MNNEWSLPPLYTDGNGTFTLHFGALNYNSKVNEVEPFFWVYINGQNTGRNVTSTGTNQTNIVEVNLTDSSLQVQSSLVK